MSVLVLFDGAFPGASAGAKRVDYYKKGLVKAGVPANIVPVTSKHTGRISYYLYQLLLPFKAAGVFFKVCKKYNSALVYGFGWQTYLLLSLLAYFTGVKIYLEINEKQGTVYSNRFAELKWIKWFSLVMTRWSYHFFDGFVVISTALEADLQPYILKGAKLIKVPIIIDTDRSLQNIDKSDIQMPYILHTGALSNRKDGMAEVFEAFAIACNSLNKQLHFYLTSKLAPNDLWQFIERIIEENGLQENVHFLGDIPEELLLSLQKYCSLVIINKHVNEQNLHNFPTKLGEYLIFEIPVITTGIGEMGKYLFDGENAFLIPTNDVQALADKIVYVIQHPEESAKVGNKGKDTALIHFDHIAQGRRLADFFTY